MQKLHFSITINAPRQKVWDTVIGEKTYPQWTEPFSPDPSAGSFVKGDWSAGSKMLFVALNAEGKMEGMVSTIAENRRPEFLSIKHIGIMKNGVEDTTSAEAKAWAPSFENYTLTEKDLPAGRQEVVTEFFVDIDIDIDDSYKAMFEEMWPKALKKLKEICE